jgi:hypothetical protein
MDKISFIRFVEADIRQWVLVEKNKLHRTFLKQNLKMENNELIFYHSNTQQTKCLLEKKVIEERTQRTRQKKNKK